MFQQSEGVGAGGVDPGLGPGGVLAQAHRAAVAASPLLAHQVVQQVRDSAGEFFQSSPGRLGDQLQPGQVVHRGQHMGGIDALRGGFTYQPGVLEAGQREIEQAGGAIAPGEALTEVGQHTVMEAGIVQLHGQGRI